jgi:hypothetical protein
LQNALQNIFPQKIVNKYDFVNEWNLDTNQDKVATKPPLITEGKTEDEILQQYIDQARFIWQGDCYWELK